MINGIYHQCHTPVAVDGTDAQKENYQILDKNQIQVTPNGASGPAPRRENYTWIKCRNGLVYDFHIPASGLRGVGIHVIPFQDDTPAWPSITFSIQGSVDGIHFADLPTAITGEAVTNTASVLHSLVYPYTVYRVQVTGAADTGWFSVITS